VDDWARPPAPSPPHGDSGPVDGCRGHTPGYLDDTFGRGANPVCKPNRSSGVRSGHPSTPLRSAANPMFKPKSRGCPRFPVGCPREGFGFFFRARRAGLLKGAGGLANLKPGPGSLGSLLPGRRREHGVEAAPGPIDLAKDTPGTPLSTPASPETLHSSQILRQGCLHGTSSTPPRRPANPLLKPNLEGCPRFAVGCP
jgi:hypothetical protein